MAADGNRLSLRQSRANLLGALVLARQWIGREQPDHRGVCAHQPLDLRHIQARVRRPNVAFLLFMRHRLAPAGPLAEVGQQLLDIGLDDPIADIAIELLPPFVEQEGEAAFDRCLSLASKSAQRAA